MTEPQQEPTERELQILKVLWERGEATVREVYEVLREELPIVQNTVQAFLRVMEQKGFVTHRVDGRSFVYNARIARDSTSRSLISGLLSTLFDGALDQLVASAFDAKRPDPEELARLRSLIDAAESKVAARRRKS